MKVNKGPSTEGKKSPTRLDSKTVRAIDFHACDTVDEAALKALILDAVMLNTQKERER